MVEKLRHGDPRTQDAKIWEPRWATDPLMVNKMLELADLRGNETVIDVGTGSSTVIDALAPHLPGGKILGFDNSSEMLAKRGGRPLPPNALRMQADLYQSGVKDGRADVVIARLVLHHLPDKVEAISALSRMLTDEGKLIVIESSPMNDAMRQIEQSLLEVKKSSWTSEEVEQAITEPFLGEYPGGKIAVTKLVIPHYGLRDFFGLAPVDKQDKIVKAYKASSAVQENLHAIHTSNDILLDRHFTFVVAKKGAR